MKKAITLLLALVMVVGLVACGAKEETAAPAATEAAPAATEAAPAATEAAKEADPVSLDLWVCCDTTDETDTANQGKMFADLAQKFNEKYPHITINIVPIGSNADNYNAKYSMAAAANSLPDMMYTSYGWVKEWAPAGVIAQLDDILDNVKGNYKTDALEVANAAVDGYWCVPLSAETQGWFYNTEILGKYNLEIPKTFDEFLNACTVLTENGELAIALGATDVWSIWGFYNMFCQNGVDEELCKKISAGEVNFLDAEPFRKTFEQIKKIADTGAFGPDCAYTNNAEAQALFASGKAAMYGCGSFVNSTTFPELADKIAYDFGPQFADKVYDQKVGMRTYGWTLMCGSALTKDAAKLEAAKLFLEYVTSEEAAAVEWSHSTIPATNPTAVFTDDMALIETTMFEALVEDVYSVPDMTQAWFDASIKSPFRTAVSAVLSGTATVDEAMQLLADWQATYIAS